MFRTIFLLALLIGEGRLNYVRAGQNTKEQPKIISGHIKDASNGETLIGATLHVRETGSGATSNNYGFYSVSLPQGVYHLRYSYLGYKTLEKKVNLTENTVIEVELTPEQQEIREIIVTAGKQNENIRQVEMGVEKLQAKTIKSIPAFMGEVDVIKAVQMLPGVQSTSEGGSGFSVRGGTPDQNLILLDEATVYNASHLMGFFSVFNNDAINDIKLYKGDIPAQYGGRLSSLLDVRMKDGNAKKFNGAGGTGNISSRLTLEGPIVKDRTTFLLSGRGMFISAPSSDDEEDDVGKTRLNFYDANLKLSHRLNTNNRLYVSGYFGRDNLKIPDIFRMGFGNQTFTVRWNHIFSPKLFMNLTTVWCKYDYELGTSEDEPDSWLWNSSLKDLGLKADFSWFIRPEHSVQFGLQSFHHSFNPGMVSGIGDKSIYSEYKLEKSYALEHACYLSFRHDFGEKVSLKYGLRASLFQNMGETTVYRYNENYALADSIHYGAGHIYKSHFGLEPRAGLSYLISSEWSVKFNYNRLLQYIQQASNSTAGSPLDIWFPASPNVKPQVADQFSLGVFRNFKKGIFQASVEAFYKNMKHTIDFADHAELLLNRYLEGEIRTGTSKAYGIEFLIKKTEGKLTGWMGYTLSHAERTIPGINAGKTYRAPYDKPHNISIVFTNELSKRLSLSANWLYATGQPVTLPVQRYEINGSIVPYYSERNGSRYNDYHRLDLSLTLQSRNRRHRPWTGEWVFSVYNAYFRKNTWILNFKQDDENPDRTYAEKIYFPILPSITYNFKF